MTKQKKNAEPKPSEPSVPVKLAELTDIGMIREENQDHVFHEKMKNGYLCVVCDGMGGHAGGRTASRLAMEALFHTFRKSRSTNVRKCLGEALVAANSAVWKMANKKRALNGMGTTCVALFVDEAEGTASTAHVGDSRCYLSRGTRLQLITRDHTVVQRMLDDGLLTREQAEHHPHANVIARSLGGDQTVDVDLSESIALEEGDLFLLCSDGLTGLVPERDIVEALWSDDLDASCQSLIDLANENGGTDNVTVQLIAYGARPDRPEHFEFLHPARKPSPEIVAMLDRHHQRHEKETSPVPAVPAVLNRDEPAEGDEEPVTLGGEDLEPLHEDALKSPEELPEEASPEASEQDDEEELDDEDANDYGDEPVEEAEEPQLDDSDEPDDSEPDVDEEEEPEDETSQDDTRDETTASGEKQPVQPTIPAPPSTLRAFLWAALVIGFVVIVLYLIQGG